MPVHADHVHDREPFAVPIESFNRWLKPSHRASGIPGFYRDKEGEYDLAVDTSRVMIYPYCSRCGRR